MRLAYRYPPTVFILEAPPAPWIFSNLVPSRKPKTASSVGLELSSLEVVSTARVARKREYIGHFHGAMNVFTRPWNRNFATYMNQEHKTGIQCLSNGYPKPI